MTIFRHLFWISCNFFILYRNIFLSLFSNEFQYVFTNSFKERIKFCSRILKIIIVKCGEIWFLWRNMVLCSTHHYCIKWHNFVWILLKKSSTEDAYSSGHLVLSHFGTCMCSNVETNLSWTCLVSGLLNFEHPSVLLFCFWGRTPRPLSNKTLLDPIININTKKITIKTFKQLNSYITLCVCTC